MQYELLPSEQAVQVRQKFEEAFIETPQEYEISYMKWAEEFAQLQPEIAKRCIGDYSSIIYWNKLKDCNREISFDDAISFLKGIKNPVYFLSDPPLETTRMNVLGNEPVGFVAKTNDPQFFAEYIYDEWRMIYTLPDDQWVDPLLPWDLYVFDDSFKWMLFFSHHNIDDFEESDNECSWNRLCFTIKL